VAVNRQMFNAVMKIGRAHPGAKIDLRHSNTYRILVVDARTNRRWEVDHSGKVRKLVKT
jgi:hypothetical protein